MKPTILAFALLFAPAKTEVIWSTGHLVSMNTVGWKGNATIDTHPDGFGGTTSEVSQKRGRTYYALVKVEINGAPFIVQGAWSPHWVFSHAPEVIENDAIKYRIKGKDLFLLDIEGKETKFRIVKTIKP